MSSSAITPPPIVFLTENGRCQPEAFGRGIDKKTFNKYDVPSKKATRTGNGRNVSIGAPGICYYGRFSHIFHKTVNVNGRYLDKKSLIKWLNRHETTFLSKLGEDITEDGKTVKQLKKGKHELLQPYFKAFHEIQTVENKKSIETKEQLIVRLNRVAELKGLIPKLPKPPPAINPKSTPAAKAPKTAKDPKSQNVVDELEPVEIDLRKPAEIKKPAPNKPPPKKEEKKVLPPPRPLVLSKEQKERVKESYKKKFKKVQKAVVGSMSFDATAARSRTAEEFKGKLPAAAPVENFLKVINSKLSADSSTAPGSLFKHEVNFRNDGDDSIEGFYYTDSVFREAALEALDEWENKEIKENTLRKNGFEDGQEEYYTAAKNYLIQNLRNFYLARDAFDQTFENYKNTPDENKDTFNYLDEFIKCIFDKNPDLKNNPETSAEFIKKYMQNDLLIDIKSAKYKESFSKKIEDEWTKCWKSTPGLEKVSVNQNRNKNNPKLAFNEKLEFLKNISSLHKDVTKEKIEGLSFNEEEILDLKD